MTFICRRPRISAPAPRDEKGCVRHGARTRQWKIVTAESRPAAPATACSGTVFQAAPGTVLRSRSQSIATSPRPRRGVRSTREATSVVASRRRDEAEAALNSRGSRPESESEEAPAGGRGPPSPSLQKADEAANPRPEEADKSRRAAQDSEVGGDLGRRRRRRRARWLRPRGKQRSADQVRGERCVVKAVAKVAVARLEVRVPRSPRVGQYTIVHRTTRTLTTRSPSQRGTARAARGPRGWQHLPGPRPKRALEAAFRRRGRPDLRPVRRRGQPGCRRYGGQAPSYRGGAEVGDPVPRSGEKRIDRPQEFPA